MSGAITVIGLTPETYTIEDIRFSVPYRTAVQIPAYLAQRSRHLGEAIQQQRIMQLGSGQPLPIPSREPVLTPMLRGRGIAPHAPAQGRPEEHVTWQRQKEALVRELDTSRAQCLQLQGTNETLQATLTSMANQLHQIQATLNRLTLPSEVAVTSHPTIPVRGPLRDHTVPHFIAPTTQELAEVRIAIPEGSSDSDLTGARDALRSLRGKPSA